jgi:hypothetical protein
LNAGLQNHCRENDVLGRRTLFNIRAHEFRSCGWLQASTDQPLPDHMSDITDAALFGEKPTLASMQTT